MKSIGTKVYLLTYLLYSFKNQEGKELTVQKLLKLYYKVFQSPRFIAYDL